MTMKICQLVQEDCQGAYKAEKMAGPPLFILQRRPRWYNQRLRFRDVAFQVMGVITYAQKEIFRAQGLAG